MKPKKFQWGNLLLLPFAFIAVSMAGISCKKNRSDIPADRQNFSRLTEFLEGETLSGSLKEFKDPEGVALLLGDDKEILFLEKPLLTEVITPGNIQHAELIYSKYGIVVHNRNNDKTWLYPLNDPDSRKKFDQAKSYLPENYSRSDIAGHTRIKLPNP